MRVVSLVPSLTETLLACGVEVVGRTRYCVHPEEAVRNITVVGGTKRVNWGKVAELSPDLVVMDKEENTREMADSCPLSWHATHVTSIQSAGKELMELAQCVASPDLEALASGWRALAKTPAKTFPGWGALPGVESLIGDSFVKFDRLEYMIWRDPWMSVGPNTFIGSVLKKIGLSQYMKCHTTAYPELTGNLPEEGTFYLFSTEPYPFTRYTEELAANGFNGALVDGEFFSWFGIRSYRVLQHYLQT